jgi:dienelactone hydrolase
VVAFAKGITAPVPGVLVLHGVEGPSEAQVEFAKTLADWGYIGFAADLFSSSMRDSSLDERQQLMTSFMQKRPMLQSRLLHILDVLKGVNEVDGTRVAAVGFCFGGLCALDLARVRAVRNREFSWRSEAPWQYRGNKIKPKVIVFHGWEDPFAPPDNLVALAQNLRSPCIVVFEDFSPGSVFLS